MDTFMARCALPALLIIFALCVLVVIGCVVAAILTANGVVLWS
jgi:hypothetical protein